jgi:hypothetical protein
MRGSPGVSERPKRALTRKDFLKAAGASAAGASLLGAAGCRGFTNAKLPQVPEEYLPGGKNGPNVILVIIDSLRRDHVGAYGNDWIKTPTLDALAEESLLFTHAQPEAMPTLPVRRAIYTGMRTWPTHPPYFGWTRRMPQGDSQTSASQHATGLYKVLACQLLSFCSFGRHADKRRRSRSVLTG